MMRVYAGIVDVSYTLVHSVDTSTSQDPRSPDDHARPSGKPDQVPNRVDGDLGIVGAGLDAEVAA
jgi:hypothetical protein